MDTAYKQLVEHVLRDGKYLPDRTGTGTISVFGNTSIRVSCRESFPILTTKRVFFRGVAEELAFFLSGKTDTNILSERGVRIWEPNTRRDVLDKLGLHEYAEGEMGPGYGFQWRHFGADYGGGESGVDQVKYVINTLNQDPFSRRAVLSAWNPVDQPRMALPPCHVMYQFQCDTEGYVNLCMTQRSCDIFLGLPFNVSSCALLLHLVARELNKVPGDITINIGDAHIYSNHIESIKEQISREPRKPPTLVMDEKITGTDDFVASLVSLDGYDPHPKLTGVMAV